MFKPKRAYEKPDPVDGTRFLIDRLWPRGTTKAALAIEEWVKEAAPSNELRQWFNHDADKWDEFRKRYFAELDANPASWERILEAASRGPVTLVYSTKHAEHNNAVALAEYLNARWRAQRPGRTGESRS